MPYDNLLTEGIRLFELKFNYSCSYYCKNIGADANGQDLSFSSYRPFRTLYL